MYVNNWDKVVALAICPCIFSTVSVSHTPNLAELRTVSNIERGAQETSSVLNTVSYFVANTLVFFILNVHMTVKKYIINKNN